MIDNNNRFWIDLMTLRTEMKFRNFTKESMAKYEQTITDFLIKTDKASYFLTEQDVRDYLKNLEKDNCESTLYQKENYLDFFYRNCLGIDRYKIYKRPKASGIYLTKEEFEKILEISNLRQKCIYMLLWEGVRLTEVSNIKLIDFDIEDNRIRIGKKSIDVNNYENLLKEYLYEERENFGDDYLFVKFGRQIKPVTAKREFEKTKEALDIQKEITPEGLRYSHGYILLSEGKKEETMKLLGYKNKQNIILKYGSVSDGKNSKNTAE